MNSLLSPALSPPQSAMLLCTAAIVLLGALYGLYSSGWHGEPASTRPWDCGRGAHWVAFAISLVGMVLGLGVAFEIDWLTLGRRKTGMPAAIVLSSVGTTVYFFVRAIRMEAKSPMVFARTSSRFRG